ncbi:MAG: VWA domain-containing protein [Verrucomicrobiales bacterium]
MSLGSPQFLVLVPILLAVGWFFRSLKLWEPLRVALLLLLVLVLCDPRIQLKTGGIDLWVLFDRSESARELVEAGSAEWRTLLERSRPSDNHRLRFVDYADEAIPSGDAETAVYPGNRKLTRTGLAVRDALARMDPVRHNRLLVFTDGFSTEPLTGVAEKLLNQGVPLDYRLLRAAASTDFRIAETTAPDRVQIGEPFVVEVSVAGSEDGTMPLTVSRGGRELFTRSVEVADGSGRRRFADRISEPGAHLYEARIAPSPDAHPGNNRHERWIEVAAGPRIVLATHYLNDPLAKILRAQGFDVDVVEDTVSLSPGVLTGARAVALNNVPAYELPNDFLDAIEFFVREQGGGLLMVGGERSFGSGGYYESSIDSLLPVSMELKSEHRKLSVAMAIVMDRSGSMAATVASGHSKMQLANEGAARAIELLGDSDAVTVFAVDSSAHQICELLNVGANRGELLQRTRRIESMGGGIFVYTGMREAWDVLKTSPLGQRHMILFSDAADSEEPGEYKELLAEMRDEDATVSVIGLGNRGDSDGAFLEDIASRGEGRVFFTDVPGSLPNIFAQETVTVARSSFVDEPTATQPTGRWYELARSDVDWPGLVDGYNLSYLREGDEAALITNDAYAAPLVAFGRRGVGKTAAVSFPLGGEFSESVRAWDEVGDFAQTLARWLMGEEIPPGIGVRHDLVGTELKIDLLYDSEEWGPRFSSAPPRLVMQQGFQRGATEALVWERLAPGHYSVRTDLEEGQPVRGAVQLAGSTLPFGPVSVGSESEWQFDPARVAELRETARTSGGSELLDLSKAWRKPPAPAFESIRDPLLAVAMLIFLLEALITRTGWKLPVADTSLRHRRSARQPAQAAATEAIPAPPEPKAPPPAPATETPESVRTSRKSRFDRAKKRL